MSLDATLETILRKTHVDGYMTAINTLLELGTVDALAAADFLENFGPELFGADLWKEGDDIRIEARKMTR